MPESKTEMSCQTLLDEGMPCLYPIKEKGVLEVPKIEKLDSISKSKVLKQAAGTVACHIQFPDVDCRWQAETSR